MVSFKDLKARYGNALAKELRDEKRTMEENKGPDDAIVYFMQHPDLKSEAGSVCLFWFLLMSFVKLTAGFPNDPHV